MAATRAGLSAQCAGSAARDPVKAQLFTVKLRLVLGTATEHASMLHLHFMCPFECAAATAA
jgi:hypothetical protein